MSSIHPVSCSGLASKTQHLLTAGYLVNGKGRLLQLGLHSHWRIWGRADGFGMGAGYIPSVLWPLRIRNKALFREVRGVIRAAHTRGPCSAGPHARQDAAMLLDVLQDSWPAFADVVKFWCS